MELFDNIVVVVVLIAVVLAGLDALWCKWRGR